MATSRKGSKDNAYTVTEADRTLVTTLAAAGLPQKEIAKLIKVSLATLRKYYKEELDESKTKITALCVSGLYKAIKKGNIRAITFWLNTQCGWSTNSNVNGTVGTYDVDKAKQEAVTARKKLDSIYGQSPPAE